MKQETTSPQSPKKLTKEEIEKIKGKSELKAAQKDAQEVITKAREGKNSDNGKSNY